jgi:hypothetical protein
MTDIKHPIIEIRLLSVGKRCRALTIGDDEYVLVSYADSSMKAYCIYNYLGRKVMPIIFNDLKDAIKVAEWFEETYREYLPIWEEYERADLPRLAQWTIRNGVNIYRIIENKQADLLIGL